MSRRFGSLYLEIFVYGLFVVLVKVWLFLDFIVEGVCLYYGWVVERDLFLGWEGLLYGNCRGGRGFVFYFVRVYFISDEVGGYIEIFLEGYTRIWVSGCFRGVGRVLRVR